MSFGQWLKQQRKNLDLTQEGLAERVGCSDIAIRKIEAGQRRPSRQVAELLADIFNVPTSEREEFISFARGLDGRDQASASEPVQRVSEPPVPGLRPTQPGNLPVRLTHLIGREDVIATLRDLLAQGAVRLLTLTGAPGIGKTRLALQVARDVQDHFKDGAFFVGLAPVDDPELVAPTIAEALGLSDQGTESLLADLQLWLRNRQILLVLDNFEQIIEAAPVVAELLGSCPELKVLVTSREVLHITGEQRFQVPPLQTANPTRLAPIETLVTYPAVALFIERARAVEPNFGLTEKNAQAVAAICARLDGLPLAIELVAAHIRLLTPQEMQVRLDTRLPLASGGLRDLPARQQTLTAAIDWSYSLLTQEEQTLFARLGVFVGGCALAAVEAVCNATGDIGMGVLRGLASLVDKSLLQREEDALNESRFTMLEMIREYAAECLVESGEGEKIKRLHAEYHLAFAEVAALQIESPEQAIWLARLESVHDNMRAALQWSQSPEGDPQLGLRLTEALAPFWTIRGHFHEGRAWLSRMFSRAEGQQRTILLGKAYARAGRFAFRQSDYAAARGYYTESLAISRELADMSGIASALRGLGNVATEEGDYLEASHLFEEGLAIARELGDLLKVADCLVGAGWAALHQGNYALANEQFEEALTLCRNMDHKEEAAFALSGLGEVAVRQGEYVRAVSLIDESLTLRWGIDDRWGIAISLGTLAWVALRQGDHDRALQLLRESILMREELGDKGGIAWCLERFAEIEGKRGYPERATKLYGAAHSLRQSVDSVLDPLDRFEHERNIAFVSAQIGPASWDAAWAAGRAMNVGQAVAYALERNDLPGAS